MKIFNLKFGLIALLIICTAIFATCEFSRQADDGNGTVLQDTLFLNQWRKEKIEKLQLISDYENKLSKLQIGKDSLKNEVSEKKKVLNAFRFKANYLETQLKNIVSKPDSNNASQKNLSPIVDSLIIVRTQSDTACIKTIQSLENLVSNRDSAMVFQKQIENNLRDLEKEQKLRSDYLTEQLNIAYKNQRKRTRQNKLLAGGLLILSGITTSLLITQNLK